VAAHVRGQHGRTPAVVENISAGGVFVRTDKLEPVGAEVSVDLVKPGWKKALTLDAKVTSCVDPIDGRLTQRPPGMGLQFLRIEDKQFARLRILLRELGAPDPGEGITLPDEAAEEELRRLRAESTDPVVPQQRAVEQQLQMVEDAIEGALREANLEPPGPLEMEERARPPPPLPEPLPHAELSSSSPEVQRLMVQIKGLVLQLADAQQQVSERDAQIEKLREKLDIIRSALARAVRKS